MVISLRFWLSTSTVVLSGLRSPVFRSTDPGGGVSLAPRPEAQPPSARAASAIPHIARALAARLPDIAHTSPNPRMGPPPSPVPTGRKTYDEAYYTKWYRDPRTRVHAPESVRRKVRMVTSVAEHFLGRKLRTVLDIGAGEGAWRAELRRLCADVLQYVPDAAVKRGLRHIAGLLSGVAFMEAYTTGDDMEGDLDGWHRRSKSQYRRIFADAGLVACGIHCYLARELAVNAVELELV